jgi:deazaflavin-dependent oxidoreductase (nitroreductase family)
MKHSGRNRDCWSMASESLFPQYRPQAEKTSFERALQAFAQTRAGGKLFLTVLPAIDRRLLPLSRGRLSTGFGQPLLLLHTRGAKSGLERTTPLLATQNGTELLIVASRAGDARHPGWYHNLLADSDIEVTVRGQRHLMRARVVNGEERERAWSIVCDNYAGYATYQRRVPQRPIPIVSLRPRAGDAPQAIPIGVGSAQ